MRLYLYLIIAVFYSFTSCKTSQLPIAKTSSEINNTAPKLVVGIVVDQMRYDYLTRFYNKYGDGGFKRLMKDGYNCKNTQYNYVPTYTAPGHASIYTGTTPKYHGIISNSWYDKKSLDIIYCAEDKTVNCLGCSNTDAGQMSPKNMQVTTFADENRLFHQMRAKTIGISIKDRGAILPAGHTANAAYWFEGKKLGQWISSSFYMNDLPQWVKAFNASDKAATYLDKIWKPYYDISTYTESGNDLNTFEGGFKGKKTATFPYNLSELKSENNYFNLIKSTPFGIYLTTDFALAAIDGEQLGQDNITDVLTISYSSTDYIGHNFGVNSKEIEDTYIRLDKDIERLLNALDEKIGVGHYTVFLTADHAAVNVPSYLTSKKVPSGYADMKLLKASLNNFLMNAYGSDDLIENISNFQIFLNHQKITSLGLNLITLQEAIVNEVITYPDIYKAYTAKSMQTSNFFTGIEFLLQNGYSQKRSGDVLLVLDPAVISYSKTGSTHGSGFQYDTHVPLLFYGKGIAKGSSFVRCEIVDIAPTISALLGISFPSGATGKVLDSVIAK